MYVSLLTNLVTQHDSLENNPTTTTTTTTTTTGTITGRATKLTIAEWTVLFVCVTWISINSQWHKLIWEVNSYVSPQGKHSFYQILLKRK